MATLASPLVLIPARMASTRLPGKMLADIGGAPMIAQVWRRAMEAKLGPVAVACDDARIAQAIEKEGGQAVMTRADHPSGSDRIFEALQKLDPEKKHDIIINLQGDLPTLDPKLLKQLLDGLADEQFDIATLAAEITDEKERSNPSVVKPVMTATNRPGLYRALYFTRATAPTGEGPLYHHIGIYAYRRAALEKFVSLKPGALEQREKLEQLRALENGMNIAVCVVNTQPLGVDTPEDLEKAREILGE